MWCLRWFGVIDGVCTTFSTRRVWVVFVGFCGGGVVVVVVGGVGLLLAACGAGCWLFVTGGWFCWAGGLRTRER